MTYSYYKIERGLSLEESVVMVNNAAGIGVEKLASMQFSREESIE